MCGGGEEVETKHVGNVKKYWFPVPKSSYFMPSGVAVWLTWLSPLRVSSKF